MNKKISDKEIEKIRYNKKANSILLKNNLTNYDELYGVKSIPLYLRDPIIKYEDCILRYISSEDKVLELGSGIGIHSELILRSGANVIFSDISNISLSALSKKFKDKYKNFKILESDMESIPLTEKSVDIVCSAGSISYGDNEIVMNEVLRLLKPGGLLIIVDSLNDNPVYFFNRWINYLLGKRTMGTIKNMLTIEKIEKFQKYFELKELSFFGSIIWTVPFLKLFFSNSFISVLINKSDKFLKVKKSAFKFCFVMKKNN